MKELWELFIVFAKIPTMNAKTSFSGLLWLFKINLFISAFTFGGGYAMLPILQREVVENRNWVTSEELMDYYAIGQCTPGIIAVNTATFIGYKRKGIIGGIVATVGCIFPSLVIIMIIAAFINSFTHIVWVQHALAGIRVCVCVLVLDAVIKLAKKSLIDAATYLIFAAVVILSLFTNVASFVWIVCAGAAGVIIKTLMERSKAQKKA